jgi:hypothetical protein
MADYIDMDKLKPCPFCGENGYGVHLQKIIYATKILNAGK